MAGGQYVFAEDFDPTSRSLPTAVAHAFRGVEDFYRTRAAIKDLKPDIQIGKTTTPDNTTLDEPTRKGRTASRSRSRRR